jgi:DNA-binding CsgD family transcriptional regulator
MPYDPEATGYAPAMRRRRALERLGLLVDYDGPLTDRGLPKALGDFILQRWKNDPTPAAEKWGRLLNVLEIVPQVAEKDIDIAAGEPPLTHIERRTLYLLSLGFAVKQIAQFDGVSQDTVKERLRRARARLGATNTLHAVAIAIRRELLWS